MGKEEDLLFLILAELIDQIFRPQSLVIPYIHSALFLQSPQKAASGERNTDTGSGKFRNLEEGMASRYLGVSPVKIMVPPCALKAFRRSSVEERSVSQLGTTMVS